MRKVPAKGPADADVMIVGEAPGEEEELRGEPFVGASGRLVTTMLREAGIQREKCFVTNVCKYRPPGNDISKWVTDKKTTGVKNEWDAKDGRWFADPVGEGIADLWDEIVEVQPKVIVGLGNVALWALTGQWGITDWRGSELVYGAGVLQQPIPFVPTLHPASVLRNWATRPLVAHDLRFRVARRLRSGFVTPEWDHNWTPTFDEAMDFIMRLRGDTAADVETSRGQIVCLGLATSARRAMCIPFISEGYGAYWTAAQRFAIIEALRRKFERDVYLIWQNGNYDASYFDENWGFVPPNDFDTLIAQSVLFPGTPRGLGYLSSMYCDWHCYWKDDARDWSNLRDFDSLFAYNCRDVCATLEVAQGQRKALAAAHLESQFAERMRYARHVFNMQQRGVIRDHEKTSALDAQIDEELHARKIIVCDAAGREINLVSPPQVSKFLYDEMGCRRPARRGRDPGGTGNDELEQVAKWHPEHSEVLSAIQEYRSLASMRNNFLRAELDPDGRLRSSFMTTGTETFRLTSSKNNFGRGTNLLNVSGGGKTHKGTPAPNFRAVIVPPTGHVYFDCDLARADLQIVVWEADDADLKAKMRAIWDGDDIDIHIENAKDLFGVASPSDEQRQRAKTFVHLTDYGGKARTAAIAVGCTVHEADMAQRRWFAAHPGILEWHRRIEAQLQATRTVTNKFGYRRVYQDRLEGLLPEALAWIPQSTIAIVASKVHMAFDAIDGVTVTLQCYDSVAGYYPVLSEDETLRRMFEATKVVVPYDDPLIIPMGLSRSRESWGDCKKDKRGWP